MVLHDLELVSASITIVSVKSCHTTVSEKPGSFLNRAEREFLSSFGYLELLNENALCLNVSPCISL